MNAKNVKLELVNGIGKKLIHNLHAQGLYTAEDLLLYWPKKYDIYEPMDLEIASKQIGNVCFSGQIISQIKYVYYRPSLNALTFDINVYNNKIHVIIFNRQYLKKVMKPGSYVKVYGKYNKYKKEMMASQIFPGVTEGHIDTSYRIKDIPDKTVKRIINNIISEGIMVEEYLPQFCFDKHHFVDINQMIKMLHNPTTLLSVYEARRRKKYEEILEFYLQINYYKSLRDNKHRDPINYDIDKVKELISTIPFEFSEDQKSVTNQLFTGLKKDLPINRIIQGDVGSGKTIVALVIAYAFKTAGKQTVLMAPTEILASQHYKYFKNYLDNFGVRIELLTASRAKRERDKVLQEVKEGKVDIIIGTHKLFYDKLDYKDLGLAIIDEQQRFGVNARNKLLEDRVIDSIFLSATPIPRTLALTLFSDLDISTIKTVRKDKLPIKTKIYSDEELESLFDQIEPELKNGHQGYFVVSAIESSIEQNRYDIDSVMNLLSLRFPEYRIGYIHGKLKDEEKNKIMEDFINKELDIIVSTTVIEVGISVDNATFIAILDSQNFGLATLHQLRGRVGRSNLQGYCYLVTSQTDTERLHILEESNDGFYLSEMDLKLRGPGEYFGTRQSGVSDFIFANFSEDLESFKTISEDAKTLLLMSASDVNINTYINKVLESVEISDNLN